LQHEEKKLKEEIKDKSKWKSMGLETFASMTRCNSPSTKEPICECYISLLSHAPHAQFFFHHHFIRLHDFDQAPLGKDIELRETSPIGHLDTITNPRIVKLHNCLSICLGLGGLMHMFGNFDY
jgi:hypothetical protein